MSKLFFDKVLLVSDIDGTLSHDSFIHQRNIDAINRFIEFGGIFSIATGRNLTGAKWISEQLGIKQSIICLNGSVIYDLDKESIVYNQPIDSSLADIMREIMDNFPSTTIMCSDYNKYFNIKESEYVKTTRKGIHDMLKAEGGIIETDLDNLPSDLSKGLVWDYEKNINQIIKYLDMSKYPNLEIVQSNKSNIEIINKGVSKGFALRKLADIKGIDMKNTCAIGDFYNDVPMLKTAYHTATTCEAPEDIKSLCNTIVGKCEDGAVADFINHLEKIYTSK